MCVYEYVVGIGPFAARGVGWWMVDVVLYLYVCMYV